MHATPQQIVEGRKGSSSKSRLGIGNQCTRDRGSHLHAAESCFGSLSRSMLASQLASSVTRPSQTFEHRSCRAVREGVGCSARPFSKVAAMALGRRTRGVIAIIRRQAIDLDRAGLRVDQSATAFRRVLFPQPLGQAKRQWSRIGLGDRVHRGSGDWNGMPALDCGRRQRQVLGGLMLV